MNKTLKFRGVALYLILGIPLAASCAKEASSLDSGNGAGTSGKGSTTTAGTFNKAGTTGSSPFGGTATTAGNTGGTGDSATEGGDDALGGQGGVGGSAIIPPEVLASAKAVVYYETTHAVASDRTVQMKLHVVNRSDTPLPMKDVKIRYWLTAEAAPTLHQYYTGPQAQDPGAAFVDDAAKSHVLMTFGGGSIVKGADLNASEVQLEIDSVTTAFDQADDWSWQPTSSTSDPNPRITMYLDDTLIWGCEPPPGGQCFADSGMGGASGAGGQDAGGGAAGQSSVAGAGTDAGAGGQGVGGQGVGGAP